MEDLSRQALLQLLNGDWAEYVSRFQAFSPPEQSAFLEKQGYQRLADLLAHMVAWWQVGLESIRRFRRDPDARQLEIDVDPFNARAIEAVRGVSDEQEIRIFESTRQRFTDLVVALSDENFQDERILNQLRWELVNHLDEHSID